MQQIFSSAAASAAGYFRRLRSNSFGNDAVGEVDAAIPCNSGTDLERKSPPRTRRYQELDDERTYGTGKRSRGTEDVGPEQKRTRQSIAGPMNSLLPKYGAPTGSVPISFERPGTDAARMSNTNGIRSRVGGGGHRPMNTLDHTPHATQTRFMGGHKRNEITKILERPSLDTIGSRGRNVHPAKQVYGDGHGDGFKDDPKPVAKRQKITNGASKQLPVHDHIDLTKDDSQMSSNISVRGKTAHDFAALGAAPSAVAALEEPSVHSKVNKFTATEREKKKRKPRNSQSSGQSSAPGTPEESQFSQQVIQRAVRRPEGVVVIDDSFNDGDKGARTKTPSSRPNTRPTRPRITAPSGAPTHQPSKPNPGSPEDIIGSTSIVNARRRPPGSSPSKREPGLLEHAALEPPPRNSKQYSDRQEARQRATEVQGVRLQDTFVRDSGPAPSSQPSASTRRAGMQATSHGPRTRGSPGSEDELAGESNGPKSISRSVSPQKVRLQAAENFEKTRQSDMRGELPPSQLKPSKFYTPSQSTSETQSRKVPATQKQRLDEIDEYRIPVKAIFCRACCLLDGDIQLVHDSESQVFLVEHNGVLKRVPNRDQLINFSGQEALTWIEANRSGYLTILIKTSSSSVSSGNVIIEFENAEDLSTCHEILYAASKDTMGCKNETMARMIEIVKKLSSSIREEFMKASRPKHVATNPDVELIRSNQRRRTIEQPDDEEQIQYEPDEPPRRSSVRTKMQAGTPGSTESSRVMSKHFQQPAERRTSRQLKPVKAKSPTPPPPPPRWSHIHKLQPWSQSVIYPPEGAVRRVTVDSQDIERLDEGEFLNDNLISFALRRIEENMPSQHKEKVLYFNTFFYSALTTKNGRRVFNYDAVKRWTKNRDLLSIPYVVVPINIDLHWFVAIICNLPNLSRKFDGSDSEGDEDSEMLLNGVEERGPDLLAGLSNAIGADADLDTTNTQASLRNLSLSDDDKAKANDKAHTDPIKDSVEPSSSRPSTANSKKSKKKKGPPRQRTFDPDAPTIITLDSFGSTHPAENRNLKEYIVAEAQEKRNISLSRDDLQGVTAKGIPEQKNFCDCGLFLIGYIEEFAKDPREFVSKLLRKKQAELEKDFENFNPSDKRNEIRDQLLKLHDEQEAERKAKKTARKTGTGANSDALKSTQPSTATASTEVGPAIETNAGKPDDTTSTVPLQTKAARVPERETPKHAQTNAEVINSKHHNAESDELETAIPRALKESAPRSQKTEEPAPDSTTVEPPTNEDDESAWEGIVSDHERAPSRDEAGENIPKSIYDHDIEHYMSPEQSRPPAQPPRPAAFQQDDENPAAIDVEGNGATGSSNHVPTQLQAIDIDDDIVPEVPDSQETDFRFTFPTKVS